ncbi:MAG TPA: hypothetical protein VGV69_03830 [Solirubrobacterales bacterium]|nr:hypothetical protein [Solirubrobacterales bacterium]
MALVRLTGSILWELRQRWASGKRVSLTLDERGGRRVEGQVQRVSPTGAWVKVNGMMIPTELILAVHNPAFCGGDSTWRGGAWHFESPRILPQAEELPGIREMLAA